MRKYLLGTGIIGAVTSGWSLLRGSGHQDFTWRVALAWLSWGITFALSLGMIRDIRKASRGESVSEDSPISGHERKYATSVTSTPKGRKK
ncbi:hypothetical protein [Microbacterium sp. G2-8]|uniref:hypothetical protein n=1 Tax=Microbacterium sp. G2-8 TaxID=2842454 RepID=UPI001C8A25DC|nr:hypothetical protein [Microbacterium sp. G2-8]